MSSTSLYASSGTARVRVFENLAVGATNEETIDQFDVTCEQINAVLEFTARSLDATARVLAGSVAVSAATPAATQKLRFRFSRVAKNFLETSRPRRCDPLLFRGVSGTQQMRQVQSVQLAVHGIGMLAEHLRGFSVVSARVGHRVLHDLAFL